MPDSADHLPLWLAFLSLREQATRDWLTGLYNRRFFEETFTDHVAAANRYDRALSLVLFDIDRFKPINDTFGHEAGDDVLRHFGRLLQTTARKADIICRYGGDEFVVILPETGKDDAKRFVKRITQSLLQFNWQDVGLDIVSKGSPSAPPVQVSAGTASLPGENLIAAADAALMKNKSAR